MQEPEFFKPVTSEQQPAKIVIVDYKNLSDSEKKIVEVAYKALYDAQNGKPIRFDKDGKPVEVLQQDGTNNPVLLAPTVKDMYDGWTDTYGHKYPANDRTASAWATIVNYCLTEKPQEVTYEFVKKAFNEAYTAGAKGENYMGDSMPTFDAGPKKLNEKQRENWVKVVEALKPYFEEQLQAEAEAGAQSATAPRPSFS